MRNVKEEVKKMVEGLPDDVTWDDVMYTLYVKQKIELGIRAAEEGRVVPHDQIRKIFPPK